VNVAERKNEMLVRKSIPDEKEARLDCCPFFPLF